MLGNPKAKILLAAALIPDMAETVRVKPNHTFRFRTIRNDEASDGRTGDSHHPFPRFAPVEGIDGVILFPVNLKATNRFSSQSRNYDSVGQSH